IGEAQAGRDEAPRPDEAQGARAIAPGRIREDVDAVQLDEERGVTDPRDGGTGLVGAKRGAVVRTNLQRRATLRPPLKASPHDAPRSLDERVGIRRIQVSKPVLEVMRWKLGARRLRVNPRSADGNDERSNERESDDHAAAHDHSLTTTRGRHPSLRNILTRTC